MDKIVKYQTYKSGDLNSTQQWCNDIKDIVMMLEFNILYDGDVMCLSDESGNLFELSVGSNANLQICLWQEYDETEFVKGHFLVCATEVMLKCFGAKVYCKLNPFRLGFAIDFLYSSKESFKEQIPALVDLVLKAREEMNKRIIED